MVVPGEASFRVVTPERARFLNEDQHTLTGRFSLSVKEEAVFRLCCSSQHLFAIDQQVDTRRCTYHHYKSLTASLCNSTESGP